ncbi:MAG: hypothetical protein GX851_07370, partial [Clostridiales bacterium]|nr:hypothetical protein [Clostridiales bacterium]
MSKSTRAMRIIAAILAMLFIFSAFPIMVSAEGEYISIKNETDLKNIKNDMTAKYRLDADIEISSAWTEPIGGTAAFEGELEGNGKTISKFNLVFNSTGTTAYAGLFSTVSGIVKNLKISGEITATNTSNSSATLYVGSIAGSCGIFGSIESCQSSVEIVAKLAPTAASGSFFGAYTGKLYVGGICGYYGGWFTLGECANKAAITANCIPVAASGKTANATVYVGGIAGYAGTIENCYNSKSITGKATTTSGSATSYVGGIVGQGNTIRTSYSNGGKITGTAANNNYVGGAAGELYSATSCYF